VAAIRQQSREREGKKEIMQTSVEDVRDLCKDLLADLFGRYIALKN
jgi:hypothetical protein